MRHRRRKSTVRWLPDKSFFDVLTGIPLSNANTASPTSTQLILFGIAEGDPAPAALSQAVRGLNRTEVDALIVDHIKGKVSWSIESNDGGPESADAAGIWRYVIRAAIAILPTATTGATGTGGDLVQSGGSSIHDINPGATVPWVNQGSFGPDGVRCLWRRSWFLSVDWEAGAQATGTLVSNEDACPPGPYLDIKPRRILKANDELNLLFQVTSIAGPGASGSSRVFYGHDLRVAAHNTKRRR